MSEVSGPDTQSTGVAPDELSISELVSAVAENTSVLVRNEIQLGLREMQQKSKRVGAGAGMFGGAALLAVYGGGAVVATLIAALALTLDAWVAALIVAAGVIIIAGALAMTGKQQFQEALPPTPAQALDGLRRDVGVVKESARRA